MAWLRHNLYLLLIGGILTQWVGLAALAYAAVGVRDLLSLLPALMMIACGSAMLVWGCWLYADEGGDHPAWALLGVFNVPGLTLLLLLLNDRNRSRVRGFDVMPREAVAEPVLSSGAGVAAPASARMKIEVKLFAILRERAGTAGLTLELPAGATAAGAGAALAERFPALRQHMAKVAYAVNRSYAPASQVLSDGDELALIPPVSGG